jgi:hypothetical protein
VDIIIISSNVTYYRHDIAEKLLILALNSNHSLTHSFQFLNLKKKFPLAVWTISIFSHLQRLSSKTKLRQEIVTLTIDEMMMMSTL